ncbi:AAA domain-containing protein [Psidium guajava]|nr:AAA domain-containing protein [Psidium guajava]
MELHPGGQFCGESLGGGGGLRFSIGAPFCPLLIGIHGQISFLMLLARAVFPLFFQFLRFQPQGDCKDQEVDIYRTEMSEHWTPSELTMQRFSSQGN